MKRRVMSGFSLVELMVVVAIIAIIFALVVPSVGSLLAASTLTSAGQAVVDQVGLARQLASTQSSAMEVRLIRLSNRSTEGFHAMQVWGTKGGGVVVPMSRLQILPEGTFITSAADRSPFFKQLTNAATMPEGGTAGGAAYVSFRIRPGGTIVPQSSNKGEHCLTIVPEKRASGPNFVTLQINPDTGTVAAYRP